MENDLQLRVGQTLTENQQLIELLVKKNTESITAPEATEKKEKTARAKKPAVKTFEPIRKENKSKKLPLLLKPTLFDRVQAVAQEYEISTSELLYLLLENKI